MSMKYNKSPISLREGKIFIDGVECLDSIKCNVKFTPDVWTDRQLGEAAPSSRWLGYSISGEITRRRSNGFLKEAIKKFQKTGETPELTIQGIMNDRNSDYYKENGSETVTVVGCVLTGDINILSLDSGGTVVEDTLAFNGKEIM